MEIDSSFRDPNSRVFTDKDGKILRRLSPSYYATDYAQLMSSGLYRRLVRDELLVPHVALPDRVIEPEVVPFISYPYEWCPSIYKDAALTTLRIQQTAMEHGMTLKDASAYNVQLVGNRMKLMDTASFAMYEDGEPWVAYDQFCRHFLCPLALMNMRDPRTGRMMSLFIDGIPIDLTSRLLPRLSRHVGVAAHIHAQAALGRRVTRPHRLRISKNMLIGVLGSLERTIRGLPVPKPAGGWSEYTTSTSYTDAAAAHKQEIVSEMLRAARPKAVWDMGANDGIFSQISIREGAELVVSMDSDPYCMDICYRNRIRGILPLVMDLTNPSPAIGWANRERMPVEQRGSADAIMALALVHHLAIGNNVPLPMIADWLSGLSRWLIVEFVPKEDPQVRRMLAGREDIFDDYTERGFLSAFSRCYNEIHSEKIRDSCRSVYLFLTK